MILAYDREHHRECQVWGNVDWSVLNPEDLSEDIVDAMLEEAQRNLDIENALPFLKDPSDMNVNVDNFIRYDNEQDHVTLKALLVTSFSVQFRLGQVYWPKRFAGGRRMHGLCEEFLCVSLRKCFIPSLSYHQLFKGIASCELFGSQNPDDYTVDMGMGLFSLLDCRF